MAGMSGVPRARCLTLNFLGLTGWAVVHHRVGAWLEPWTAPIVRFLQEHVLTATLICVALVALYQGHLWRKRGFKKPLQVLQNQSGDETPQ
jgi:membrane protein DedA with SNARE-associated domain